jgi:hypothetical protein
VETRLRGLPGLGSAEVLLRAFAAQTYRPGHHNFTEDFLFEPQLDPAVPAETLAALRAANVRALLVTTGFLDAKWLVLGFDDRFRELP